MQINWGNESLIDTIEKELPESTFYWLLISIGLAIVWIVYLTYYNSRILGLILTIILNRFYKYGHVQFGSFSFSVLSGKVMFRDVHLITEDFSIRVQLGLAIFRWWRPLILKEINEDLSHSETRLSVYLDTFELHVYNRSENFARLEKLFGLDEFTIPKKDEDSQDKNGTRTITETVSQTQEGKWQWRDLIPVIKLDISAGKMVFGNYQLPTTLSLNFGDAHVVYTTKPASTPFDQFMHIVKCRVDNIRVMLVPSPKYIGPVDEPPRFMGEGFVVLQSNMVDIYHYHDEPGYVPYEPELVQLANGDVIARRTWPCWGADVKSGKATDLSFGPWADRQREFLWKFFYPPDYQKMEVTVLPEPGQRRIFKEFDFKMSMQADATFDILFTKNKETQAIHMNTKAGSYLEFTVPWITEEMGYVSKVNGQLMHLDATTSLQFRSLLECETLEFDIEIKYPTSWNEHQDWKCDFTACKATLYFVFSHKTFFMDLMEDWSSRDRPDLFHFIPYTWRFSILMKQFELNTLANQHNWIDCFGQMPENSQIAFCGETFDLTFNLPFIDFVPTTVPIKFFIRGESVDCRVYLPETNTSRHILLSLANNMKVMDRDGTVLDMPFSTHTEKKWRRATQKSIGWVDCWTTPIVALSIGYTYNPIPSNSADTQRAQHEPISTPDAEEQLLIPLRLVPLRPLRPKKNKSTGLGLDEFDPTQMEPDVISVELEVGPSVLCLFGSLLRNFLHVKENYFGEDQKFTDYVAEDTPPDQTSNFTHVSTEEGKEAEEFDPCQYRPLHVKVQVTLHDIQAHLVKNSDDDGPPCPCIYLERLGFEMDKSYEETKLQVSISPAILVAKDTVERPASHAHLREGHMALSGLQVRGHAMFSHEGLPLDTETLEYAWLLEATVGDVTGRLTASQLQNIVEFLQTFVFLVEDSENDLRRPCSYRICQHGLPQPECHQNPAVTFPCPTTEDIKYRMTRATVDCIDLYLVETGAALNLQVYPVRVATCNLHGKNNKAGVTALIPNLNIKQLLLSSPVDQDYSKPADLWLEAGGVSLGPLNVDAAMALPSPEFHPIQDTFLKLHDKKTHRLWFLWPPDLSVMSPRVVGKCGCVGGCRFFGTNRNGPRFFQPDDQDFVDGINTAVFHICTEGQELGYGQSLLQKGQLIFDIQGTSLPVTPSKSKLLDKGRMMASGSRMSVDTPRTSTTLVDDGSSLRQSSLLTYITDHSSLGADNMSSSEQTLKGSDTNESHSGNRESGSTSGRSGRSGGATSIPSDLLPESPMPDPYDTDHYGSTPSDTAVTWLSGGSGSATSLPDVINQTQKLKGHERKYSYDASKGPTTLPRKSSNTSDTVPIPSSPLASSQRKDSLGSLPSYASGGSVSRQSSLTSPVLRRLSSQFSIQNDGSQASMTGSERFFSAPEDVNELLTSGSEIDASHPLINGLTRQITSTSSASEYRSFSDVSMGSPGSTADQTLCQTVIHNRTKPVQQGRQESTSSDTESLASFVSAVSSQVGSLHDLHRGHSHLDISRDQIETEIEAETGDTEGAETPTNSHNYVDLHGQINQQITKSPLLMSCYINHLTQLHCSHWSSPPPLPHLIIKPQPSGGAGSGQQDASSSFHSKISSPGISDHAPTPAWIPHFAYKQQGFGPRLMVAKREPQTPPSLDSPSSVGERNKNNVFPDSTPVETDLGFTYDDHVSKTTAVVNLKGAVDIMISPLLFESLQRYVEAVTPLLANLHPSTIVDWLHMNCSNSVKAQNKLKTRSSRTEATDKQEGGDARAGSNGETSEGQNSKTSRIQVMFSLSKMNINILQVSLVEEVISIAALDYVRDLTCVSVLAVCLDNITCQLLANNHSHKTLELGSDASPDSVTKKGPPPSQSARVGGVAGTGDGNKKKADTGTVEPEPEQGMEMQRDEVVGNLHISRIHFQLRRMKKNSNFSDRVILTAIPEYRSKVLFTFHRPLGPASPQRHSTPAPGVEVPLGPEPTPEDLAGFIMFECGLEDINLRAAKRSGFQAALPQDEENLAHIDDILLHNIQEKTGFPGPSTSTSSAHASRQARGHSRESSGGGKGGLNANNHNGDNTRESDMGSVNGSNASGLGNSADDEDSSWHSRVSFPSEGDEADGVDTSGELQGDASSCVLEFRTAWFNFAAPPPSPRKRKLEYTRLDWNLLSTFTPAINAWMNPGHRAMVSSKVLVAQLKYRVCTVMACIMTEALDYQRLHLPARHKYGKITSLAKTLQEDPSCQLLAVLQKYIKKVGLKVIDENINVDTIPQLITIQKGLLALTRQWKNVLYMPIIDTSFKNRKRVHPYTVTFAIPNDDSMDNFTNLGMEEPEITGSLDNFEVVDEKTSLLKAEGGSIGHAGSLISLSGSGQGGAPPPAPLGAPLTRPASAGQLETVGLDPLDAAAKTSSVESVPVGDRHTPVHLAKGRSKGSMPAGATPYSSIDSPAKLTLGSQSMPGGSTGNLPQPPKIRRNESNMSFPSGSVSMSSVEVGAVSVPGTPLKTSLTRQLSELEKREDEDLYRWMQRQQEYTRLCNHPNLHYYPSVGHDSFINAGLSEYSQDDSISMQQVAMAHSLLQLADAQVLFKPLLAAIGIHLGAVKTSAFMKKFGGNVSIQGKLLSLRIDIVDSETGSSRKNKGKTPKAKLKKIPKLHIDTGLDTPAFLCDTFAVVICMKDMVDFEKDKEDGGSASGLDWRRRSLRAIKFAMDHMEAKPTTTKVHFSINCNAINQHVNMSLLRLVHQFVTMIENINETRVELSGHKADYKTHRKQDSKGSSTGTESAEQQEGLKGEGTSPLLDADTPTAHDIAKPMPSSSLKQEGPPPRPDAPPKRPREAPPRPEAPPSRKRGEAPPRPEAPPQRAGSKMVLDSRPDRLPVSLPSAFGKSPKKFSFKRGKAELFGSKSGSDTGSKSARASGGKTDSVSTPPLQDLNLSDSAVIEMADTSSPALAEKTIVDEIKANTPKCWRTLYHLLELYSTMPETKTLGRRTTSASRLSVIDEEPEKVSQTQSLPRHSHSGLHRSGKQRANTVESVERQTPTSTAAPTTPTSPGAPPGGGSAQHANRVAYTGNTFTQSIFISESIPLVVFGIAKVKRIRISAMLSGLKLEADLQNVHTSATHRERVKGVLKRKSRESSATAYVGHTMIVLLEGVPPSMQTVVTVNIAKSQGLYSSVTKRSRDHNSALVTVGKIDVDIPQHPVVLHGMVARSSRRLSSTLQEFMRAPTKASRSFDSMDGSMPSQQPSKHSELNEFMTVGQAGPGSLGRPEKTEAPPTPMVIHFKAVLQGLVIGASLLPSLKAQYKMGEVSSSGVTGKKARFTVDLPNHSLSFSSKVSTPITLPSSASVDLPPIHIHADYRQHSADTMSTDGGLTEGLVLREGNYLNAVAEVGAFEHSLTTDLLNHLVFVQKVFMKEVNEVVQKVSGTDQPVPLWTEEGFSVGKEPSKPLLYSLHFTLKGIQITATTPTSNAVRLETGCIELELSNRVQTASKDGTAVKNSAPKVFVKAQVDLNLALGTLLRNPMFEEAEPEFQHLASFATRIGLRNALQDEMIPEVSKDQEALLISLKRPVVFVQPAAFDKAVLVWLNYKNAYEYWNEQRLALNKEVQTATQQVIDKLPLGTTSSTPALGTLFLQLTVEDLGICLPMTAQGLGSGGKIIDEPGAAMVLTLESTQISACSCGSLVSKGRFTGFSLRFADDFEVSWDDWKPDKSLDLVMNAMVVPEGTYEVCSRTSAATERGANPSWILNVMWQMCGIDVHLDTNIGKRLSTLGNTLTSLAGEQSHDDENADTEGELQALKETMARKSSLLPEGLPPFVYDTSLDAKTRARLIEQEMNEQAKIVQDLKQLGATNATIDIEARKLAELEAAVFNDFRQDIMKKIKRQSVKATALKDKLGLGYKPAHIRSKSTGAAPVTHHLRRKGSKGERRLASYREDAAFEQPASPQISPRTRGATPALRNHQRALSIDADTLNGQRAAFDQSAGSAKDMFSTTVDDPTYFQFEDTSPSSPGSGGGPGSGGPGSAGSPPYQRLSYQDMIATSSEESDNEDTDPDLAYLSKTAKRINFDEAQDGRAAKVPSPSVGSSGSQKAGHSLDPSVDFQLDIKVEISSGQCVLHPKEKVVFKMEPTESEPKLRKRDLRGEASPNLQRKRKKHSTDSGRFHHTKISSQQPPIDNTTVFFLPGLDVKVHYNSKTEPVNAASMDSPTSSAKPDFGASFTAPCYNIDESPRINPPIVTVTDGHFSTPPDTSSSGSGGKKPEKKASLYAWLYLQQLSEEMLITPVLLDFLEQALEPIPMVQLTQSKSNKSASSYSAALGADLDTSATSLVSSSNVYSSFPVDVVVYIRVQPSLVRFSCLPVSRVECLLRLPSLDLVFSTKRGDVEGNMLPDTSPPTKAKGPGLKRSNSLGSRTGLSSRARTPSGTHLSTIDSLAGGGLSVTGCLADFSLYIFHPYGGGQKKTSLSLLENSFKHRSSHNGGHDNMQSPLTDAIGRKDSLSLNVEFVKVNISRSRRGVMHGAESLTASQSSSKLSSLMADAANKAANIVRFSAVCDIGSASFKYDMRRLSEILALPKAWYRRSLARRVFLGEEPTTNVISDSEDETSSSPPTPESPLFSPFGRAQTISSIHTSHLDQAEKAHRRVASEDRNVPINLEFKRELDNINQSRTPSGPQSPSDDTPPRPPATSPTQQRPVRPLSPQLHDLPSRLQGYERLRGLQRGLRHGHEGSGGQSRSGTGSQFNPPVQPGKAAIKEWETLVLFAVNLARLDVMVNMSNVMGQSVWATTDLKSQGRLSIDSSGYKNMRITGGLGGSKLEAQGGIVGGKIQLHNLSSYVSISECPGHEPDHRAGLNLFTIETRLDYMGSSMLMGRISKLAATLSDEWRLDMNSADTQPLATKRPAIVFVHGDLSWDKLHLMISRSTTPDLVKMASKLEEFFYQQFHSSKRVLSAFGPIPGANRKSRSSKNSSDEASWISEIRHHRHWQKVLERVSGCKLSMFNFKLPTQGTILGGTVSLHGNNLSLACFHGINFRSKSWALFTMDEPYIGFATEAQDIVDDEGAKCTHIVENLSFQLGHNFSERNRDQHMATICKLSRSHYMPPPFTSVQEWFHYAFASSEIKNLDDFPPVPRAGSESPQERRSSSRKSQDYNHETEVIFALPSLQMHLKAEHLQGEDPPTEDDPKPVVECSFVTEFEDHIFVAMDAEAILFLHDLVTNYVKEKDRGTRTTSYHKRSPDTEKKPISDPTAVLKQDFREFECKTWHLEPTVRFISWAGKRIDPMGVDYILQKLGFQHARLTIPKWMQRGAMDPLDKILSVLVHRLITVLHETEPNFDLDQ